MAFKCFLDVVTLVQNVRQNSADQVPLRSFLSRIRACECKNINDWDLCHQRMPDMDNPSETTQFSNYPSLFTTNSKADGLNLARLGKLFTDYGYIRTARIDAVSLIMNNIDRKFILFQIFY